MSLRTQNLPPSLDTSHDELAKQFYIPILKSSVRYERAVGYFTSDWLRVNAEGLADFVTRGGKARWIISPILSPEDAKALEEGYEAARENVLNKSLMRTLQDLQSQLSEETRSTLAWLIADGALDFRIALPCSKLSGDFHVKFGIFYDEVGNIVAFDGSQNETARGFQNYESIKIFWNWDPALSVYVESDVHRFARLWNDRDINVRTHTVPEAVHQQLLRLRTLPRPYELPTAFSSSRARDFPAIDFTNLWSHQKNAIQAWEDASRCGILTMATGSGKTRTGVVAISRIPDLNIAVIAVPSRELVNQWTRAVSSLGLSTPPLEIMGATYDWLEQAYRLLELAKLNRIGQPIILIGTYRSLTSDKFLGLISRVGLPTRGALLLADEVHNAGASTYKRVLNSGFDLRLGMTATLERALDPEGTAILLNYFNGIVFEFGIDQAIKAGVLCSYRYYPHFAVLNDAELRQHEELTRRITQLRGQDDPDGDPDPPQTGRLSDLDHLYFLRAAILKKCEEKNKIFSTLLNKERISKALIYCADLEQVNECEGVLRDRGIPWLRFSSLESADSRQRALDLLTHGHVHALISINCLDEGVDIPNVREAVIVASSGNPRQFVQRRGRILRNYPGKKEAILYDILAIPPALPDYYRTPMLDMELRRATLIARSATNAAHAQATLLTALQPFGISALDVI